MLISACILYNKIYCPFIIFNIQNKSLVEMKYPPFATPPKPNIPIFYLLSTIFFLTITTAKIIRIKQYMQADENFDKIYIIDNGVQEHYLRVYCKEKNMVSISITKELEFQEYPRFPINSPEVEVPRFQRKIYTFLESCEVDIVLEENDNLITIKRAGTSYIIFSIKDYVFKNDDIEITTQDISTKWGMGQRFQTNFAIKDGTWTIWNRDRPWEIDRGSNFRSAQTYGHQPVYLAHETLTGLFHLVYFKNTYGFNFQSSQYAKKIKYFVTGGHIQFVILVGTHPQQILKQYHSYIGPAMVPPFWSMGFHQSRWGYKNFHEFSNVVSQFEKNELPLDVMWSDLDYMNQKAIFTVNKDLYPPRKMRELMEKKNIHYIPLIDVGVSIKDSIAINHGNSLGIFLKSIRAHNQDYTATVWPGKVHFVDYLHPNASYYWRSQLNRLYEQIPFSGVWLDMNQPSNFQGNQHTIQHYRIQHGQSINMMTIDVNLDHFSRTDLLKHKEVHAYYGHLSTVPTYEFLKKKNGRPFIISRSNSVGTGVYAGHWTGDNVADWQFLRLSISGNFLFQIFGIQMVGADICGFHKNTDEEMCSRWMQIGSFYPFARNHNENQSIPQQPYQFGNRLLETSKLSLYQRYSLIKQMYSTLVELNGTGSFYRPLIFEFPFDKLSYLQKYVQTEFLIGNYLLGAPIVTKDTQEREVYFPKSQIIQKWYQLELDKTYGVTINKQFKYFEGETIQKIKNTLPSAPPIFLRGGKLILANKPATRVAYLNNHYTLIAAIENGSSRGTFLAAKNFTNNNQIDACVGLGCSVQIIVRKDTANNFMLQWKYLGKAALEIDITIDSIKIVSDKDLFTPINKIMINSALGKEILNLS